jgi:hypothetical protein
VGLPSCRFLAHFLRLPWIFILPPVNRNHETSFTPLLLKSQVSLCKPCPAPELQVSAEPPLAGETDAARMSEQALWML